MTSMLFRQRTESWIGYIFLTISGDQACFSELDQEMYPSVECILEVVVLMHVVRQFDLQLARRAETSRGRRARPSVILLVDSSTALSYGHPFLDSDRSMPKTSSISSIRVVEPLPRSRETPMSDTEPSVAKAAPPPGRRPCAVRRNGRRSAVAQVDEQADVVPAAADAHVGQVAAHVGARARARRTPRRPRRQVGLAGPAGMAFEPPAAICAGQAVLPALSRRCVCGWRLCCPGRAPPRSCRARSARGWPRAPPARRADGVGRPCRPARPHGVVGRARNAEISHCADTG